MAREKMHIDDDSLRDQKLSKAEIKRARRQERNSKFGIHDEAKMGKIERFF